MLLSSNEGKARNLTRTAEMHTSSCKRLHNVTIICVTIGTMQFSFPEMDIGLGQTRILSPRLIFSPPEENTLWPPWRDATETELPAESPPTL
jgi:hypothetical protein